MKRLAYSFFLLALMLPLLSCPAAAGAQEIPADRPSAPAPQRIIPIGNITVMGSYSRVCGGSDLSGVYTQLNYAPVVRLSPRDYLIPLYSGLYKQQRQIINEEEGGMLYTTLMTHNFSLMYKHRYSELLTQRLTGFVSLNYNKETSDESFGEGLYDYRDYGMFGDFQYDLIKSETKTVTLLFGGKYYFRQYPNFKSLISLTRDNVPEEDEKDQNVWGLNSRYSYNFAHKLLLSLSYDFLFKRFSDKHTVDSNGILEEGKRKDRVHYLKLNLEYRLNKKFILGLNGEIELNNSNQNYYDTNNTTANFGDDVFIPHYFNYNRYEIKPFLTYLFPLAKDKNIIFKFSYAFTFRDYPNRNIKNSAGTYQSNTQEDKIQAGFLDIDFPLSKKLSLLLSADYLHTTSNMEYERYYRYDYDLYHILLGFSYKF